MSRLNKRRLRGIAAAWAGPAIAAVVSAAIWWALDVHNLNVILWGDLILVAAAIKLGNYMRSRLSQRHLG
jgi:hypothetical protein